MIERCGSDAGDGDFTFIRNHDASVVDYMVCSSELFDVRIGLVVKVHIFSSYSGSTPASCN